MTEIRGQIIRETDKAVFFHCYGDKGPQWYPNSTITNRKEHPNGTLVLQVADWIYDKNDKESEPGIFAEPADSDSQPELPLEDTLTVFERDAQARALTAALRGGGYHELLSNIAKELGSELLRFMNEDDLRVCFDDVISTLEDRGINIDETYEAKK